MVTRVDAAWICKCLAETDGTHWVGVVDVAGVRHCSKYNSWVYKRRHHRCYILYYIQSGSYSFIPTMGRKIFTGCIVKRLVDRYSYSGFPKTRAEELEVTKEDALKMIPMMHKLPVRTLHSDHAQNGEVVDTFITPENEWMARIAIDDSHLCGLTQLKQLEAGIGTDLSLCHNIVYGGDPVPIEVSVVWKGAREGSHIIGLEPGANANKTDPGYTIAASATSTSGLQLPWRIPSELVIRASAHSSSSSSSSSSSLHSDMSASNGRYTSLRDPTPPVSYQPSVTDPPTLSVPAVIAQQQPNLNPNIFNMDEKQQQQQSPPQQQQQQQQSQLSPDLIQQQIKFLQQQLQQQQQQQSNLNPSSPSVQTLPDVLSIVEKSNTSFQTKQEVYEAMKKHVDDMNAIKEERDRLRNDIQKQRDELNKEKQAILEQTMAKTKQDVLTLKEFVREHNPDALPDFEKVFEQTSNLNEKDFLKLFPSLAVAASQAMNNAKSRELYQRQIEQHLQSNNQQMELSERLRGHMASLSSNPASSSTSYSTPSAYSTPSTYMHPQHAMTQPVYDACGRVVAASAYAPSPYSLQSSSSSSSSNKRSYNDMDTSYTRPANAHRHYGRQSSDNDWVTPDSRTTALMNSASASEDGDKFQKGWVQDTTKDPRTRR